MNTDITELPGEEFLRQGLTDLAEGTDSVASLLIQIGASRIREAGVTVPFFRPRDSAAELRLYDLLASEHGSGAYGQYNALLRRLISFERALEARHSRHMAA